MSDRTPEEPMSDVTFRAGLVGAGYISEYHVAALRRLPHVEIVGIADLDPRRAAEAGGRHDLAVYSSVEELVRAGADVIHVLTPPHAHAPVALEALDRGCHVLIEKPMAISVAECRAISDRAAERGRQLAVNHSLLFDPRVRALMARLRAGDVGDVVSVDFLRGTDLPPPPAGPLPRAFREGGFVFRDVGVHALYLLDAILGPIEEIAHASWESRGGEPRVAFDEWRVLARCRRGFGQVQLSLNVRPRQSQIIVQGTRGVLRADLFLMFVGHRGATPLPKAAERVVNAFTDTVRPFLDVVGYVLSFLGGRSMPYQGLSEFVAAFYAALADGGPMPVTAEEATRTVHWVEEVATRADEAWRRTRDRYALAPSVPYLVTGAGGNLGSALVERLRADGHRVRIFVRRAPDLVPDGVEVVVGDLADPEAVDRAVRGARVVVHAGAVMKGTRAEHQRGTVEGTRNVVRACERHGVARLVHVSSLSVVRWASRDRVIDETTPLEPRPERRGAYTQAKLAAEQLVTDHARRGLPSVVVRPGQIVGGTQPLLTPATARIAAGSYVVLGSGRATLPLVRLEDVVAAIVAAAGASVEAGTILHVVGPDAPSQNEILRVAAPEGARIVRLPRLLVRGMAATADAVLRRLGRSSPITEYQVRSATTRHRFASTRAERALGWRADSVLQRYSAASSAARRLTE
jgi:predicted dehydrogenase/nucleoside-diphosphate-sugar epimerase